MSSRTIGIGYRLAQLGATAAALGGIVDAFVPRLLPHHETFLGVAAGQAPPASATLVLLLLHTLGVALAATGGGALALLAVWRGGGPRWAALSAASVVLVAEGMNAWAIARVGSLLYLGPLACAMLVAGGVALAIRSDARCDSTGD
jgi:hypothetical protein